MYTVFPNVNFKPTPVLVSAKCSKQQLAAASQGEAGTSIQCRSFHQPAEGAIKHRRCLATLHQFRKHSFPSFPLSVCKQGYLEEDHFRYGMHCLLSYYLVFTAVHGNFLLQNRKEKGWVFNGKVKDPCLNCALNSSKVKDEQIHQSLF